MWKLTIQDDQANKTVVHLVREDYSIGRAEENTIRLTERNISRKHAELIKRQEHWLLRDLKSYNGCYVNGSRVAAEHQLIHGDIVQLGDYQLEVVDEIAAASAGDRAATVPVAPRRASLMGQPDRLVMLVGPSPGAEYPLTSDKPVVIGRGEECDVSINHPSVSRVHAEIHSLGDGRYEVVDRESANGVRVNAVELKKSLLDARDIVELGDVIMKFIPAGEIYVPSPEEIQSVKAASEAQSLAAGTMDTEPPSRGFSTRLKVAILVGAVALVGALGLALATRTSNSAVVEESSREPDLAARTLAEAKLLLNKGDPQAAQRKASEIPEHSNARQTADFREIQASWADAMFEKAGSETDASLKRGLLEQIVRATTVDSVRRKRAASEIEALNAGSVDVSELPSAKSVDRTGPPTKPQGSIAVQVSDTPSVDKPAPEAAPPKSTPPKSKSSPATLVRKNPYD